MKALFATTIVLVTLSLCSSALAQLPSFAKDEPYAQARKALLRKGWKTVHEPEGGFVCQKGDPRCEGRPETVSCAGTGLANCIFRWKRKGVVIDVNTVGVTKPVVTDVVCHSGCS
ncbi:MAG: hypothetical protein AB7F41_14675 [Methylocystis sp.]|uniref:hypothetical protein n=1 Tax=Methylocystis sp. TaxID=1911079 RepID=UPI003D1038B3